LTDPYVAFWHRFVAPLVNAGTAETMAPARIWETLVATQLDNYMGGVFEEVCRDFVRFSAALPFQPTRVASWWTADSVHEIDVVAIGTNGELLVGECKWGSATANDLAALRARTDRLLAELSGIRRVYTALFSGRPITDPAVRQTAKNDSSVLCFDAKALFTAPHHAVRLA
jgi:hypothetical protein